MLNHWIADGSAFPGAEEALFGMGKACDKGVQDHGNHRNYYGRMAPRIRRAGRSQEAEESQRKQRECEHTNRGAHSPGNAG